MYLRPLTNLKRATVALRWVYTKPHHIRPTRSIAYHNEREPHGPKADQPRRKYIIRGAIAIAIAAAILSSASEPTRSDSDEPKYKKDPATEVAFPTELELPGTPKLSLLGLGVRTVSFLGIRVYSVGFYADLRQPMFELRSDGTPEERIEHIVRNTTCALRIVPVRSTSHTHLRDGFVRAIQSRITLARNSGHLSQEEEDALVQPIQTLKGLFPNVSLPKHQPLHAVLTAPDLSNGSRTLYFPQLGRVNNSWLANEFFLAYFSGQGISPAMKKSVEEEISQLRERLQIQRGKGP